MLLGGESYTLGGHLLRRPATENGGRNTPFSWKTHVLIDEFAVVDADTTPAEAPTHAQVVFCLISAHGLEQGVEAEGQRFTALLRTA